MPRIASINRPCVFFFQAEDGIRDVAVTGVQTCALPIYFEGPRLRGTVLPGGSADWLLLRADGVLELDLRVTLRTDDGALISMKSFGLRHGPPDVMAAIGRGETVDPATYYFRTTPRFETAHPAYAFLNRLVAVASGDRRAEGPIYTIHEVL